MTDRLPAHHNAPDSSHAAAADARTISQATSDRRRIMEIMKAYDPVGLTADQVTILMNEFGRNISPNQVATRMLELRTDRKIRYKKVADRTDGRPLWETRETSRGHSANVQYLAEEGAVLRERSPLSAGGQES